MLPRADDRTLSAYLLSVHGALRTQIDAGTAQLSLQRLREAADIVARVAQQIDDRGAAAGDAAAELRSLAEAEAFLHSGNDKQTLVEPRSIDRTAIEAYLQSHAIGGPQLRVTEAHLLAGGRCKTTARIAQHGGDRLPGTFILRQDWAGGATQTSVTGEFALLDFLFAHGIRVPRPVLLESSTTAVGAPFMLMELINGGLAGGLFEPPRSEALMLQLADQLGQLHALPIDDVRSLLPATPADDAAGRRATLAGFADMHREFGLQSHIIDAALEWLCDHLGDAGDAQCLIHNDLGFHNALVSGETLTAILDWELAGIGHPASDLGYIKHFVVKALDWDAFLDRYVAAGGFRIDPATIRFHALWNAVRLYGLIMQARANLAAGRVDDLEITHACADNVMPLIQFIGRELEL